MTIKIDQLGDAIFSAPGDVIVLSDGVPSSNLVVTTPLGTDYQIMPESGSLSFTAKVSGLYSIQFSGELIAPSANSSGQIKLVFDEGEANEQTIGYNEQWQTRPTTGNYTEPVFRDVVELSAGSHTVKAYGKLLAGTSFQVTASQDHPPVLMLTAVTGSGAGGILVDSVELLAQFNTSSTSFVDVDNGGGDALSLNVDVFNNEQIMIFLEGRLTRSGGANRVDVQYNVGGVLIPSSDVIGESSGYESLGAGSFGPVITPKLTAGTKNIKIQIKVSSNSAAVPSGTKLKVIRFRGGLVPIQDDGYNLIGQPQAFNFFGSGVAVTDNNGTADIEISGGSGLVDGYLPLPEKVSDPPYEEGYGALYAQKVDGYTELHYMDDYGFATQMTVKGSVMPGGPTLITEWNGTDLSQFLYDGYLPDLDANGWVGSIVNVGSSAITVSNLYGLSWIDITLAVGTGTGAQQAIYLPFDLPDIEDVIVETDWMTVSIGAGTHGPFVFCRASGTDNVYLARYVGSGTDFDLTKCVGSESYSDILSNPGPADNVGRGGVGRIRAEGQILGYNAQGASSGDFRMIVDTSHSTGKCGIGITTNGLDNTTLRILYRRIKVYRP